MNAGSTLGWQPVVIPWSAWHSETRHELRFPANWQIDRLEPDASPPTLAEEQIRRAIAEPIDSPPLTKLALGARSVCIAVDDLTRPTRAASILPCILEELRRAQVPDQAITFAVATGTHGAPDAAGLEMKLGRDICSRYRVEVHDAAQSVVETGVEYGGLKLRINRTFLDAELKLGLSSVMPHPFAGYSGGAKMLLPGLADLPATDRSHKFVRMGLRGGADPDRNAFRHEIEAIARHLGFNFSVCCVPTARGEIAGLFAGDIVAAHRAACRLAARCCETRVNGDYDCLLVNAYPKDSELVQADSALVALKTATAPIVRDGGVVVLATAASRGVGNHGLFGPGGLNYREPAPRRDLAGRELWLYSPGVSEDEARRLHWSGYPFFRCADELARALAERLGPVARAGVLPFAPLQQVVTR